MRQGPFGGERALANYAGDTLESMNGTTGETRQAQTVVGVLAASNEIYLDATWTQTLPEGIGAQG